MIEFSGRCILLDVEGTTSSVSYVYDVLFPYARNQLTNFLTKHWHEDKVKRACELIAKDAGAISFAQWCQSNIERQTEPMERRRLAGKSPSAIDKSVQEKNCIARVEAEVNRQMDSDAKLTGLKELQGLIWADGYAAGELRSHVYGDASPALKAWKNAGLDVRIYSSGSVAAQKVFFANTEAGDLLPYLNGHYDTQVGPKRESASYTAIAKDIGMAPGEILFLSDVVEELQAAATAGMLAALVVRPGNAPVATGHPFPSVSSLTDVTLVTPAAI